MRLAPFHFQLLLPSSVTLQQLIDQLGGRPQWLIAYFLALPLIAGLAGLMAKNEGHLSPWKYLYSVLIYAACVPGIFSVALNVYLFLFERRSIFQFDIYSQILPFFVMLLTLWIISRNVSFAYIPGFDKISGLVLMIFATISLMWIVDRTHLVVFSYLRFEYVLGIFAVLLLLMLYGWKRIFG